MVVSTDLFACSFPKNNWGNDQIWWEIQGKRFFGKGQHDRQCNVIYSRIRVSNLDVAGDLRIHEVFMKSLSARFIVHFLPGCGSFWMSNTFTAMFIATKVMMRIITVDPKWSMWGMFIESTRWIATTYPCICFMKSSDGSVFAMKSGYVLLFQPPESRST